MSTLRQLVAAHAPLFILDACSATIQVGWLTAEAARWEQVTAEAGIGLFRAIERLAVEPAHAGAFVYCDGPGSILGVRTAAAAIRAWTVRRPAPAFAFHGLVVLAHALGDPDLTVIADARRDCWHAAQIGRPLARVPAAGLPERLATPAGFRSWSVLPPRAKTVEYSLAALLPQVAEVDLFRSVEAPDAFLHEEPSYARWTPQIHRAP